MYLSTDPRSALTTTTMAAWPERYAGADYVKFYEQSPALEQDGSSTWLARGQNFVIAYTDGRRGVALSRAGQVDEYVVLLPDAGAGAAITWNGVTRTVGGHSIAFVPAGDSTVTPLGDTRLVRMFTTRSADLSALCANAASYATPHPNLPPFQSWPDPASPMVRCYSLDVPAQEGRFGRIFRCSTFMVNFLDPKHGPRDTSKMSPHHHDDFEQCSLALAGTFVHHLRWPWTPNMAQWRDDEHVTCGSPSVTVIPPPAIHTSQAIDPGLNLLVDIFCPPRVDFSSKPGWVLNADDYPMPAPSSGDADGQLP